MDFMFDSANLAQIEEYSKCFPIVGVTSNPSIIKSEGKIDFFSHFKEIRKIIGDDKSLHIQVLSEEYDDILKDAEAILKNIDEKVYIKIPVAENGLRAIRTLKSQGVNITATAIYTKLQGFMAILAGADYIAPYCNRMQNIDIDFCDVISSFRAMIEENASNTKILSASFKNITQITDSFMAGAHTATVQPTMLHEAMGMPSIGKAVKDFRADWDNSQGKTELFEL